MVIALAQNSQFHLKLALKPFWPYTLLFSASVPAMSRFTPGKSGAGTSSLPASCCHPPPSLLHGKQSLVGFLGAWVSEVGVELRGCAPAWALTWERAGLLPHPSFICVATCAHPLCSCALESSLLWCFVLENKIWECYRGSWCLPATTLRESWTAPTCRDMGQLWLPQNVLQRSRLQGYLEINIFCFPKYN